MKFETRNESTEAQLMRKINFFHLTVKVEEGRANVDKIIEVQPLASRQSLHLECK